MTGANTASALPAAAAEFVADPTRYLQSDLASTPTRRHPAARSSYTCPMHPQIVRDAPGACPICGMALEPMMPTLDDGENPELTDFRRSFWWTLPLSLVVLALAMGGHRTALLPATTHLDQLALSSPVVLWAAWPFFVRWLHDRSLIAARTCGP